MDRNVDIVTLYCSAGCSDVKWDNYLFALVPFIIMRAREGGCESLSLKNVWQFRTDVPSL